MFIILVPTLAILANGQSQSSCLVQKRIEAKQNTAIGDSPFSVQQHQCIDNYVQEVRQVLPHYDLSDRRFGGLSRASATRAPILGAGFGTTATRSLTVFARQFGLKVRHYGAEGPAWQELYKLLTRPCGDTSYLNEIDFQRILLGEHDLLLDTPMAEFFLDFYAASPQSKVLLTHRDPQEWAEKRSQFKSHLPLPLQSPCGNTLDNISTADAAKLFTAHEKLVRCMVPPEKLLEINVFEPQTLNTTSVAMFLGAPAPEHYVPFPRISGKGVTRTSEDPEDADAPHDKQKKISLCITGQIRRLELRTKINRLILPLMAGGARVEVFLVLDPRNSTAYIHRRAGERIGNFTIMEGPYQSLSDTVDAFPSGVSVVFDPFVAQDFSIDPRYVSGMAQERPEASQNQTAALQGALERARSHMRQWQAMQRCWELMNNLMLPDIAIRLRDDAAILETFELPDSFGVHVPKCADYSGLNDKAAIVVGTGNMLGYFTMPLQFMRFAFDSLVDVQRQRTNAPLNPECVLLHSMMLAQVPVHRLGTNKAPILPGKFLTDGNQAHLCYFQGFDYRPCIRQEIWTYLSSAGKSIYDDADPSELKFICERNVPPPTGGWPVQSPL